jgi:serine/threonine-protein kinase HipA
MGRKTHNRALEIWSNGEHVGTWNIPARGDMEFIYTDAWQQSPGARPLSLSLPFGVGKSSIKTEAVENFFQNLLPDSEPIRKRMAEKFKLASTGTFDLLESVGRDCVGAVQLLPCGVSPTGFDQIECKPLSEDGVAQHLKRVVLAPGFGAEEPEDEFRISLAGAQEKTALLWHAGQWNRPLNATPTTHIFKLPLGLVGNSQVNLATSVENEWLCLQIMKAYGLPVAHAEMATFNDQRVLVVERFDRKLSPSGRWWMRLPQEDFCQVMGLAPNKKYECDGGPGFGTLARLLQQSTQREQDLNTLLASQVLFWMLAATDGHAKNFSIKMLAGGRFHLTPIYDVLSAWPVIGRGPGKWQVQKVKLAMSVSGQSKHYKLYEIKRRHFNHMARQHGFAQGAESVIQSILERTPSVIESVRQALPDGFPAEVADAILSGLGQSAEALAAMAAT